MHAAALHSIPRDAELTKQLATRIDVTFRKDDASEVLENLGAQTGLLSKLPPDLPRVSFDLERKGITVREVLDTLVRQGSYTREYHGPFVVLWREADGKVFAKLLADLKSDNARERCKAVWDLSRLADERVYVQLFKALDDPDPAVSKLALRVLARHRDTLGFSDAKERAAGTLIRFYKRADRYRRTGLLNLIVATRSRAGLGFLRAEKGPYGTFDNIAKMGTADAARELGNQLRRGPKAQRSSVALAFQKLPPSLAWPQLKQSLRTLDPVLRKTVVTALLKTKEPFTFKQVLQQLKSSNYEQRLGVVLSASRGSYTPREAEKHLVAALSDQKEIVRHEAAKALAKMGKAKKAMKVLIQMVNIKKNTNKEEWRTRRAAADALGKTRDPAAVPHLKGCVSDRFAAVQKSAVVALGELRDARATAALLGIFQEEWKRIQAKQKEDETRKDGRRFANDGHLRNIVQGLIATRDPKTIDPLLPLLRNGRLHYTKTTLGGLFLTFRDEGHQGELTSHLEKAHPTVVARLLGGQSVTLPETYGGILDAFIEHEDEKVRAAAIRSLAMRRGPHAIPVLLKLLGTADVAAKTAVVGQLGQTWDREAMQAIMKAGENDGALRTAAARALKAYEPFAPIGLRPRIRTFLGGMNSVASKRTNKTRGK